MQTNKSRSAGYIPRATSSIDGMSRVVARGSVTHQSRQTIGTQQRPPVAMPVAPKTAHYASADWQPANIPRPQPSSRQVEAAYFPLPVYQTPERPKAIVKKSNTKRILLRSISLAAAMFVIGGGFIAWQGYMSAHRVFKGTDTVAALSTDKVAPNLLNGEGDGRVNILLLGVGGAGHDGADLTDTIIVLSVDPVNNKAALLSVPRDMWVKMPVNYYGAYQKINAAYSAGKYRYLGTTDPGMANSKAVEAGFNSIDQVVSEVLGVNINYHLLVDFKAFKQAIDTVNGVSVDVKDPLYDPTMAWENHNNPLLAAAGLQQMDGKEALLYARSRHTSSDFARSERQRQLLVALKEKVLTLGTLSNPAKINSLMQAFSNNAYSDLSTEGASRLFTLMRRISDSNIESIGLTTPPHDFLTTDRVGDLSVVRPKAGFSSYSDIQAYVKSQLKDGYLVKENAQIIVIASSQARADDEAETLKGFGYNIIGSESTTTPVTATTLVDLTGGTASYTRHYLENRFQVRAASALPPGIDVPDGTQFAILVQ